MTALADAEIIRKTELPNGSVVLTIKHSAPYLIRPFQTCVIVASSRYAQRVSDWTCEAAALHQHDALVRDLMKAGTVRKDSAGPPKA